MPALQRPSRFCIVLAALFIVVSAFVVSGITQPLDVGILVAIGHLRDGHPVSIAVAQWITRLGNGSLEIPVALAIVAALALLGRRDRGLRLALAAASGELLYVVLKVVFHRPRPDVIPHLGEAGWYSYPSGHAMLAPIIWGFGLVLLARTLSTDALRVILWVLAIAVTVTLSLSRLYLGVHYPSDVLAALLIGCAWVAFWREPSSGASSSATSFAPAIR